MKKKINRVLRAIEVVPEVNFFIMIGVLGVTSMLLTKFHLKNTFEFLLFCFMVFSQIILCITRGLREINETCSKNGFIDVPISLPGVTCRMSSALDKDIIKALFMKCFGDLEDAGAFLDLDDRYLLAFKDDELIAITGICDLDYADFNGRSVEWTCVEEEYRHHGIVTEMLEYLLSNTSGDIYCSAWVMPEKDRPNLYYALNKFGFKLVVEKQRIYHSMYCGYCKGCVERSENCVCHEDLYLLHREASE